MIDRTAIVAEALMTASTLYTEVGDRVWSPIAPAKGFDGTQSAIVFHQSDASAHPTGATNSATFEFKCYGDNNTYTKARTVFRLLYDRLQQLTETMSSGSIIMATLDNDFQLEPEPETNHKAHLASFTILFTG